MKFDPNSNEFKQIIREEAMRLKKRIMLENEKKAIIKHLNEMEFVDEQYVDEAAITQGEIPHGGSLENLENFMRQVVIPIWIKQKKYKMTKDSYAAEMAKAAADQYRGQWAADANRNIVYSPKPEMSVGAGIKAGSGKDFGF